MDLPGRSTIIHLDHSAPVPFSQETQRNLHNFLKGEPIILGVSQIMIGLMNNCLWIIQIFFILPIDTQFLKHRESIILYLMLLGPVFYIISGALSIVSGRKMTKNIICVSLGMNTMSTVLAGASLIICSFFFSIFTYEQDILLKYIYGFVTVQLILTGLEFFIALSLSAFGCHAVCCSVTSVVVDLSSNEHELSVHPPYYDYDEVAFPPF